MLTGDQSFAAWNKPVRKEQDKHKKRQDLNLSQHRKQLMKMEILMHSMIIMWLAE